MTYVYAVRNVVTGAFAPKYSSNHYYLRKGDATKRATYFNKHLKVEEWVVVQSELNWSEVD